VSRGNKIIIKLQKATLSFHGTKNHHLNTDSDLQGQLRSFILALFVSHVGFPIGLPL